MPVKLALVSLLLGLTASGCAPASEAGHELHSTKATTQTSILERCLTRTPDKGFVTSESCPASIVPMVEQLTAQDVR